MDRLVDLSSDDSWRVRQDVALNPSATPALVETLARDSHPRVRRAAAHRAELDSRWLDSLADDGAVAVRRVIAGRADTPTRALDRLSEDVDEAVRCHVAGNVGAGPEALSRLAADKSYAVRVLVAANLRTPGLVLARLVVQDDAVGLAAAGNPSTPAEALAESARRKARDRPWARVLAGNRSTPGTELARLASRSSWDVQIAAAANPSLPDRVALRLLTSGWRSVHAAVARHTTCVEALEKAATDLEPMVQLALAGNPACPPALLRQLGRWDSQSIRSGKGWVLGKALSNPNLPHDLVERVANIDGLPPWVMRAVAHHPACPPEQRDSLLTWVALGGAGPGDPTFDPDNPIVNPEDVNEPMSAFLARQAARQFPLGVDHPLWPVRLMALNKAHSISSLTGEQLARDPEPAVRRRAASFFLTPATLHELRGDADQWTAKVAASTSEQKQPAPSTRPLRRWGSALVAAVCVGILIAAVVRPTGTVTPRDGTEIVEIPGGGQVMFTTIALETTTTSGPAAQMTAQANSASFSTKVIVAAGSEKVFINSILVVDTMGRTRQCRGSTATVVLVGAIHTATCVTNGIETAIARIQVALKVGDRGLVIERRPVQTQEGQVR